MKRQKIIMKMLIFCLLIFCIGSIGACGNKKTAQVSNTSVDETEGTEKIPISVENYKKKMKDGREDIASYIARYQEDAELVRNKEFRNLHFENCEFKDVPDIKELKMLVSSARGISTEEAWQTLEDWLKRIGKSDEVDLKKEAKIVSDQFELPAPGEEYPNFYDSMPILIDGNGAFVDLNSCYLQLIDNGAYSMSDGKMSAYVGSTRSAFRDADGRLAEDVVKTGTLSELGEEKYQLMDGELSVQEGAELVKQHFEAGTPFPNEEGVVSEIPVVSVFKLKDLYGYNYTMRRIYESVPFAYAGYGSRRYEAAYLVNEDRKHAYVVDSTGVSAYLGYNEAQPIDTLVKDTKMMGISEAAEYASQQLAAYLNMQVESVELVYTPMLYENVYSDRNVIFPCWLLNGENISKGEKIRIYIDVFTGDIYFYTFESEY